MLLLLLSRFSRVWLCATPWMAAHQAPPSLGFSRQEHWSGLPVPSPMHESEKWKWSHSVISDCSRPHGLQPTRLLRPWEFPGKSTGAGCHCLLQCYLLANIIGNFRPRIKKEKGRKEGWMSEWVNEWRKETIWNAQGHSPFPCGRIFPWSWRVKNIDYRNEPILCAPPLVAFHQCWILFLFTQTHA